MMKHYAEEDRFISVSFFAGSLFRLCAEQPLRYC